MRTVSAASWKVSAPDVDLRTDVRSDREGLAIGGLSATWSARGTVRRLRQGGDDAELNGWARGWLWRARRPGLSASRQAFMPPHACLWRSLGRHAFRIAPAPPVDHAHRPLHCKVPVSRHVSLLWTGRVHGPYPLIIAERPSELKPNAAMFHGASRECPPRDPRILNRSVTGVDEVFRRNQKKYAEAAVHDASQSGPPGF
jgi:hypothetical protein